MFAAIYIPDFALQAVLRHEPELLSQPVVLVDPKTSVVIQLTPAARAAGVNEGLTSTQALARCPGVVIRNRSLRQENVASEIVLQCAYCFSPAIEATSPGVSTLDLQGLSNAGTERWGRRIIDTLK